MGSGKFNSIMNFFKIDDDEYDEDYDDNMPDDDLPPAKPKYSKAQREEAEEENPKQRSFLSKPKVVPMSSSNRGLEVNIIKPTSFEDSQEICNMLLANRPVVVNLEGFDPDDAQRIMDFISGCIYSINGKFHQISKYIFIFSPENVDISGDSLSFTSDSFTAVPTINREF